MSHEKKGRPDTNHVKGELVQSKEAEDLHATVDATHENPYKTAPNKYTTKDMMNNTTPE
jgi:hypothetical protein